ncbi:uncharacterized protein [Aegilops tauschii subsp. strangulata]|uniref:uncharacterized protein n=1 Tax=Aegilops tauschii subsp. strangulata TaxID=200361 RepID=UPI003CC89E63
MSGQHETYSEQNNGSTSKGERTNLARRHVDDFWSWIHEKNGVFSIRSAYSMLVNTKMRREAWLEGRANSSDTDRESKSLEKLWKVNVLPKVKIFLWRLAQQSIPTTGLLHHRNMSTSTRCGLCGAEDSWKHSLLHCTVARCVWALQDLDLVEALNNTTEPDARIWLFVLLDMLSPTEFTQVAVTILALWHSRRQTLHENIFQSPLSTHNFISKYIREIEECRPKMTQGTENPIPVQMQTRWVPPPPGVAKVRVDGATARNTLDGLFSDVCRDDTELFLGASVIKMPGVVDPATLGALACREALALASDLHISRVVIASDCQGVIRDIKEGTGGLYASTIKEVNETARDFDQCTFIFEGRLTNIEAHSLAKNAFRLDYGRHLWLINPPDIHCIPMNFYD